MEFVPRYSPEIPVEAERIMFDRAVSLVERNEDCEFSVGDLMSRYAERFIKKSRYFKPEKFSLEQFVGLQCGNVNAELMGDVIDSRKGRQELIWLDEALELHGEEVTSEQLFVESSEAELMRREIQRDVRETIERMTEDERRIAKLHLVLGSLRQVEAAIGAHHGVFHRDVWPKFCRDFKEIWGDVKKVETKAA